MAEITFKKLVTAVDGKMSWRKKQREKGATLVAKTDSSNIASQVKMQGPSTSKIQKRSYTAFFVESQVTWLRTAGIECKAMKMVVVAKV